MTATEFDLIITNYIYKAGDPYKKKLKKEFGYDLDYMSDDDDMAYVLMIEALMDPLCPYTMNKLDAVFDKEAADKKQKEDAQKLLEQEQEEQKQAELRKQQQQTQQTQSSNTANEYRGIVTYVLL